MHCEEQEDSGSCDSKQGGMGSILSYRQGPTPFWTFGLKHDTRAVPRIFFYRGDEVRGPQGDRRWVGFLAAPTSYGSWERCKLPQRGPGRSPAAKRFSRVLNVQRGHSRQFGVVYYSMFHSSNFCQGKSHEKQPKWLPRLPQCTLRHWTHYNFTTHVVFFFLYSVKTSMWAITRVHF